MGAVHAVGACTAKCSRFLCDVASEYPNSIFGKRVVPSIGFEENVRNVLGLAAKFLPLGRNLVLLQQREREGGALERLGNAG